MINFVCYGLQSYFFTENERNLPIYKIQVIWAQFERHTYALKFRSLYEFYGTRCVMILCYDGDSKKKIII